MTEIEKLKQQVFLNEAILDNLKDAKHDGRRVCRIQGRFVPVEKTFEVVCDHLRVLRDRLKKAGV